MARIAPVARLVLLLAAWVLPPRASWAAEPGTPPLVLERTIPLQSSGRIDHMAVDLRRGRLFVAELGNGSVDVVDLATGRAVHRFAGLREPQGVGYAPQADLVAVACSTAGTSRLRARSDWAGTPTMSISTAGAGLSWDTAAAGLP